MAFTTIDKSTAHHNTKLYTGNGSNVNVTGLGFQPDLTWLKRRNIHIIMLLFDSVRGSNKNFKFKC